MTLYTFLIVLAKLAAGTALLIWAPHVDHSIAGILFGAATAVGGGALAKRGMGNGTPRARKPTTRPDTEKPDAA